MGKTTAEGRSKAKLREQINENLRRVYEDRLKEDVPDRFKELLAQLREKGANE